MATNTHYLETPEATLAYDVHGPLPTVHGEPPLMMIGAPMDASGFNALLPYFTDRTVVTYDPRGLGRSTRDDGRSDHTPEQNAADVHAVIAELDAGPVELLASSGGAITALELVARHPTDVSVLVAHEPPLLSLLPDSARAFAAEQAVQKVYADKGWGHGMAAFVALTMWPGEFTDDYAAMDPPSPDAFGLPTADDGSRDDPLLSGVSNAVTAYEPDFTALRRSPTKIVVAVGADSEGQLTGRTTVATAEHLGQQPVIFPGGHGGFMGEEGGPGSDPEGFARVLRGVLEG